MLRTCVAIVLIAACSASIFENGLKKLGPLRNEVRHFAMNVPEATKNKVESKFGIQAQDLLGKLSSSLLLRGAPQTPIASQQLLPLLGLLNPGSQQQDRSGKTVRLQDFKIANCSNTPAGKTMFDIKSLSVSPDPVVMPGKVNFQFDIDVKESLDELQIALDFRKQVGENYIRIPCIGQFGSCTYDVCQMLNQVSEGDCPPYLVDLGFKCRCPFDKKVYQTPAGGISPEIDGTVFIGGNYNVTATMTSDKTFVGCYTAAFSISEG